jgi:integrase
LDELSRFYPLPLETLSCHQVQLFLDDLIRVRLLAWATVNVYFSAYRFLYEQVLKRTQHEFSIPPRGRSGTQPGVLNRKEVERLIQAPRSLKHRTLLAMTYGSGLRVSEVVRVRIADVDRGRMMLRVEQGKGHKDRYTVLSARALKLLEELWRKERPEEFFFSGKDRSQPLPLAR